MLVMADSSGTAGLELMSEMDAAESARKLSITPRSRRPRPAQSAPSEGYGKSFFNSCVADVSASWLRPDRASQRRDRAG